MNVTCEKIGDWTVKANKEAMKNDPAHNKKERYLMQSCTSTSETFFDTVTKELFTIKGEKRCEKWEKEHAGEWATDF